MFPSTPLSRLDERRSKRERLVRNVDSALVLCDDEPKGCPTGGGGTEGQGPGVGVVSGSIEPGKSRDPQSVQMETPSPGDAVIGRDEELSRGDRNAELSQRFGMFEPKGDRQDRNGTG